MPERDRSLPISLGDALRVEADLHPADVATWEAVEKLLGYERLAAPHARASVGPWKPNEPAPVDTTPKAATGPKQTETKPDATRPPVLRGAKTASQFVGRIEFKSPPWVSAATTLQPAAGTDASLPPPALFSESHARAILSAMFATFHDGPEVDVDHAASVLANGRRLDAIPFVQVATLRRGAQLLVDRAAALDPLRHDVRQVLTDVERLFGRGHIEVLYFAHCPSLRDAQRRGVSTTPRERPEPWRSPGRGVPVLIVSDFTLATRTDDDVAYATVGEWEEFVRDVLAAGCHPVGLVPFPPSRWPATLGRLLTFVHWSERTTARQLLRALRETRR